MSGSSTFWKPVARGRRLKVWKTKPIRPFRIAARSSSERTETRVPSRRYSPEVGVSRQPRRFISVDFPEPEGPMIAM